MLKLAFFFVCVWGGDPHFDPFTLPPPPYGPPTDFARRRRENWLVLVKLFEEIFLTYVAATDGKFNY